MSYVHAFCVALAVVMGADYIIYLMRSAPKSPRWKLRLWFAGFASAVFELGWWCF